MLILVQEHIRYASAGKKPIHYFSSFPISILIREPCSVTVANTFCEHGLCY